MTPGRDACRAPYLTAVIIIGRFGFHKEQKVDQLLPLEPHVLTAGKERPELDAMQKQQTAGGKGIDLGAWCREAGLDVVQHVVQLHRDAGEGGQQREDGLLAEALVDLDRQVLQQLDHLPDVLDRVERTDRPDFDVPERRQAGQFALAHTRMMVTAHRHVERFVLGVRLRLQRQIFHTDRKIANRAVQGKAQRKEKNKLYCKVV